ncbi:MAG TPA: hypothetical protein VHW72_02045 [Candidatus Angelobacter sp.]|nr:hypothetical protein [Candidatus Angelobacter sp.]
MHISQSQWIPIVIAVAAAGVQAFTLRILNQRKLRTEFPVFFRYSLFCVAGCVSSLIPFIFYCPQYFYVYWSMTAVTMALEFAVMYELLVNALKPYSALIDLGKMLFRWAAVFLVLAALLTALATAGSGSHKMVAAMELLQRTVRLMQCGLLLLFFGLEKRLGLTWRTHSMSIALGLGIYAGVDLSTTYLIDRLPAMAWFFEVVTTLVYLGAASLWAYSLAKPEPARSNVLESPRRLIFQRWNEALLTHSVRGEMAFAGSGMESFLPGVEQTVERVLARKIVQ